MRARVTPAAPQQPPERAPEPPLPCFSPRLLAPASFARPNAVPTRTRTRHPPAAHVPPPLLRCRPNTHALPCPAPSLSPSCSHAVPRAALSPIRPPIAVCALPRPASSAAQTLARATHTHRVYTHTQYTHVRARASIKDAGNIIPRSLAASRTPAWPLISPGPRDLKRLAARRGAARYLPGAVFCAPRSGRIG